MDLDPRALLLPRSGVGLAAPWLVIAPTGQPVIRLDLRLVDRLVGASDESGDGILIACGDLEVGLYIVDGRTATERIVAAASRLTRIGSANEASHSTHTPGSTKDHAANTSHSNGVAKFMIVSSTPDAEMRNDDRLAGSVYELSGEQVLIGRANTASIVINHRSVSREHAKVTRDASTGRYAIADFFASNGVHVNGERCTSHALSSGDIVDLGHVRMRFVAPEEEAFWFEPESPPSPQGFLFIGCDAVVLDGAHIRVGAHAFRVDEVFDLASQGENLPVGRGRVLQATMALLVVALAERHASAN